LYHYQKRSWKKSHRPLGKKYLTGYQKSATLVNILRESIKDAKDPTIRIVVDKIVKNLENPENEASTSTDLDPLTDYQRINRIIQIIYEQRREIDRLA
jgi:hypothetical protein